uniref:LRRCT domain-containing protein n=1 Tax=Panagrellus redivivus TaxID=6233 RepID=A0A7E4VMU4_PANRE
MRSGIVAAVLLAAFVASNAAYCPTFIHEYIDVCTCEEYTDGAIVKCSGKDSIKVVEKLKAARAEVRELWVENAKIIQINAEAFNPLRLKKLVLDNNLIKTVHQNAFKGLESVLQELSINSNKLKEIPTAAVAGLRSMSVLSLKCNNLGNLTESAFHNNPSLIEINLSCNQICEMGPNVFENVRESVQNIVLDNNCFTRIPTAAIKGLLRIVALHMNNNKITTLGSNDVVNVDSLSMLRLGNNQIETIEPDFAPPTNRIRYVYLDKNQIKHIIPGTFKQFNSTEVLDLSYNMLTEVPAGMFEGMDSLQSLNLGENLIKEVSEGAFSTTPLLLLWLPHNCITQISPGTFQGIPFLKQVSLANNNIRTVAPLTFAHLANLHTVDLSHNKILNMESSALTGSNTKNIQLMENPFVCTQDGYHVLNGQEAINLTTAENLICATDYTHDNTDACPTRKELPVPAPCCVRPVLEAPTTLAPFTAPPVADTTTVIIINGAERETTTTPAPRPVMTTVDPKAQAERLNKINMARFWRLSGRTPPGGDVQLSAPTNNVVHETEAKPHRRTQSYREQLLPYLRQEDKAKSVPSPVVEFSEDAAPESVSA